MIDWNYYRSLFPVVQDRTYFMTAGGGALPKPVFDRLFEQYRQVMHRGGDAFGENFEIMEQCREKLANLINAEKECIAFIPNVSFGMNAIAHSLVKQDAVFIPDNEFPSSVLPWENIDAPIETILSGPDLQQKLVSILQGNTLTEASMVTSSISYVDGYRLELGELGSNKGNTNLIINHTQGMGVYPVDVQKHNIDALVGSCYKWMCCGEGISFLYISPEFFKKMKPAIVGWRSVQSSMSFDGQKKYFNDARVFELGWDNMTSFAGFSAALDLIDEIGIDNISNRVSSLSSYLLEKLEEANIPTLTFNNEDRISGNVLIGPYKDPNAVMEALQAENIWVNPRGEGIRISLNFYNNNDDIDKLLRVLPKLMQK